MKEVEVIFNDMIIKGNYKVFFERLVVFILGYEGVFVIIGVFCYCCVVIVFLLKVIFIYGIYCCNGFKLRLVLK